MGEPGEAAETPEETLALTRQTGDRSAATVSLHLLAQMAWASEEHERAARDWWEALTMASELADQVGTAYCMQGGAAGAGARGAPRRAARLLGAAESLLEAVGLAYYAYETSNQFHRRAADAAREELGERAWTAARDEGRAMSFEQPSSTPSRMTKFRNRFASDPPSLAIRSWPYRVPWVGSASRDLPGATVRPIRGRPWT